MERPIEFEWDTHKAGVNLAKHGVSFEEARGVFSDPKALVVHCFRSQQSVIRIISARRAGTREQKPYWTQ